MKKSWFAVLAALVLVGPLWAGTPLESWIGQQKQSAALRHVQWSLYAVYVDDGTVLLDIDGEQSLAPASGFKLFTTALALDNPGADFRFKTRLRYTGHVDGAGVLRGDLIITGGGDPTLGSDRIEGNPALDSVMSRIAGAVEQAGIKSITGDLIADLSVYPEQRTPGGWNWMDLGNYYGAGAGALNINDNLYRLYFDPGKPGERARVAGTDPPVPGLTFINHMKTGARGSGDQGYIYAAPGQWRATLRGSVPAGGRFAIKGSLPDPALFVLQRVRRELQERGVTVAGALHKRYRAVSGGRDLLTLPSPPLSEIVTVIHRRSFNLYAEAAGRMATRAAGFSADREGFEKALKQFLQKRDIDARALRAEDACGLSAGNAVTVKMMTGLLRKVAAEPWFDIYYNSLSVAGDAERGGFFKKWGRGTLLRGNARIKSGLIGGVRSHSGYVTGRSGRRIAFSFIANHYQGSLRAVDRIHEKLLLKIATAF